MSNSALIVYKKISPNHSGIRTMSIDRISPHCVVGQCSIETLGAIFADPSKGASSNYGIDKDGRIGMFVEESYRSWCTSSNANDQRAVTIECASDTTEPYAMNDAVYTTLIKLCADICKRNGKNKLIWFADKNKSLKYSPAKNEMVITVHRWFANKSCPGDWLYARLGDLAKKVTALLNGHVDTNSNINNYFPNCPFDVQVIIDDLNYRSDGSMNGKINGQTGKGRFTIVDVNSSGWGKLKSGAGWIYLQNPAYVTIGTTVKTTSASLSEKFTPYLVRISINDLNVRSGAGTNYNRIKFIEPGVYTIVEEKNGKGATKWGKLKSGAGWISLDYATKL